MTSALVVAARSAPVPLSSVHAPHQPRADSEHLQSPAIDLFGAADTRLLSCVYLPPIQSSTTARASNTAVPDPFSVRHLLFF